MSSIAATARRSIVLLATAWLLTICALRSWAEDPELEGDWPTKDDVPAKDAGLDAWMELDSRLARAWEVDGETLFAELSEEEQKKRKDDWDRRIERLQEVAKAWKEGNCELLRKYVVEGRDSGGKLHPRKELSALMWAAYSKAGLPQPIREMHLKILSNWPDDMEEELRRRCRDGLLLGRPRFSWNQGDLAASGRARIELEGCLPGTRVELIDTDGSVVAEATTNDDGKATFRVNTFQLEAGSLTGLRVRKNGQDMPLRRYVPPPRPPAEEEKPAGDDSGEEEESGGTPPDEGALSPDWGHRSLPLDTLRGRVTVDLPDQVFAGDTLSGRVVIDPAGESTEKQERNRKRLGRAQLAIAGTEAAVSAGVLSWTAPASGAVDEVTLSLSGVGGTTELSVPIDGPAPATAPPLELPELGQAGRPATVPGPFDGSFDTTGVTVGGQPAILLTESPRELVFEVPLTSAGVKPLRLDEAGTVTEGEIRVVGLEMSASRLDLRPGERSTLTLRVSGLEGITEPVRVRIFNLSPAGVRLGGGDRQTITVPPDDVPPDGRYEWQGQLTGLRIGTFEISAQVVATKDR